MTTANCGTKPRSGTPDEVQSDRVMFWGKKGEQAKVWVEFLGSANGAHGTGELHFYRSSKLEVSLDFADGKTSDGTWTKGSRSFRASPGWKDLVIRWIFRKNSSDTTRSLTL